MRLYHFIDAKYGIENLRNQRLKISRILDLNDPFEFLGVATNDQTARQKYQTLKARLAETMGLICFSKDWQNPVQWSHYADRHRGICLGFEVTAEVQEVRYLKNRLRPNLSAMNSYGPEAQSHVREIISSKFEHWSYEKEHRLFLKLDECDKATGLYFFDFCDAMQLREVIVGAESTISREDVRVAVGENNPKPKVFKSRLAFRSFKVTKQNTESLWK